MYYVFFLVEIEGSVYESCVTRGEGQIDINFYWNVNMIEQQLEFLLDASGRGRGAKNVNTYPFSFRSLMIVAQHFEFQAYTSMTDHFSTFPTHTPSQFGIELALLDCAMR